MSGPRTVWKFPVLSTGPMEIDLPVGAEIVHVDRDPSTGLIAFWAEVYPERDKEARRFSVVGTGHDFPDGSLHRGSVILGARVWHLFELVA